ncbi:hypothetical protein ACOSQ2_018160 [Xanthoceras sorbifolium]
MGSLIIYLSSCLCLSLLLVVISLFNKLWWIPRRIQTMMGSQGIRGPPYKFIYGNTKEIINMKNKAMNSPMELSHHIFPRIHPSIYSWVKLYGKNFINWYGHQAQLVVTEPELIKEILNNKDGSYPKTKLEGYVKKLLGEGLVTSEGEKWFKQRKLANHAFHGESLKGMIPAMIASVEMMLERWRQNDGKEIDVFQEFRVLTSEVISRTAFGSNYLKGEYTFAMLMNVELVKKSDDTELDKLEQEIRESFMKMIKEREEKVKLGKLDNYAYHDTDKTKKISIDDIIDKCKTFYLAGHETTTSLLTWTILLLAIHTDWQENVRKEVLQLFGKQNPTPDNIGRLKTMSMVFNETLRLYPPVINLTRRTDRKVKLGNLTLPPNMEVNIPITQLHHNPYVHLFKPERFSEGVAKATNNNTSIYLPFGLGPRTCVGLNFASTEAKIALSMILQRYKFSLSPNYFHAPMQLLTLGPQHGLQIKLHLL